MNMNASWRKARMKKYVVKVHCSSFEHWKFRNEMKQNGKASMRVYVHWNQNGPMPSDRSRDSRCWGKTRCLRNRIVNSWRAIDRNVERQDRRIQEWWWCRKLPKDPCKYIVVIAHIDSSRNDQGLEKWNQSIREKLWYGTDVWPVGQYFWRTISKNPARHIVNDARAMPISSFVLIERTRFRFRKYS